MEQPRDITGRFGTKSQTAPAIELAPLDDRAGLDRVAPISTEDRVFGVTDGCGEIARRIVERTGWRMVALHAGDSSRWIHAAVETPDGNVIDVSGSSAGGQHILDDDNFYHQFDEEELASVDGEVWLETVDPASLSDSGDLVRSHRIADELHAWAIAEGL